MNRRWLERLIPVIFLALSVIFFREYFLSKRVPLPFNLLASFYSPWKYYTWPGYDAGIPNKPLGHDNIKLFYPYRKLTIEELKAGRLPLWNPYVFSGNVHHATYQSAIFYPLNIIYFILPLIDAWSIMVIIQPFLTGWFTYLFLQSLKLSRGASFFGALGFAVSGWMLSHWQEVLVIEHGVLWLPLALYASNILWDTSKRARGMLLLVFSLVSSILAGFPQIIIYIFGTVLVWNIYRWFIGKSLARTKYLFIIGTGILLSIVLGALQWIPALEAFFLAPRARVDSSYLFQTFLSPLYHLVTLFAPDFWGNPGTYNYFSPTVYLQERTIFIGLASLTFALFIIFRKTKGAVAFWKYFTLITFSLGFALPTSWIWYVLRVPVLSVAMPVRIFVLSTFGFCVLSAFGIEQFLNVKSWKSIRKILIAIGLITVVLWLFVLSMALFAKRYPMFESSCVPASTQFCKKILDKEFKKQIFGYANVSLRNLIIPTGLLFVFVISIRMFYRKEKYLYVSVYVITIAGSLYLANKLLYFSDRQFEYPFVAPIEKLKNIAGFDRVWSYGDGYVVRNILSYYRIFSPEGYEALYPHRYGTLLNTIQTKGNVTNLIHRNDATLSETGQNEVMTYNPIRLRMMSLLGIKYILEAKDKEVDSMYPPGDRFPEELFRLAWEDPIWRIWEYKKSLPRSFFVKNSIVESDQQKIVDFLLDSSTNLQDAIVLEEKPETQVEQSSSDDKTDVQITSYYSSEVIISVDAPQDGFVFLSDTYYPGWKAFIDNKETKIYRADYAFRAVPVTSGKHTVRFVYDPISFKIGLGMSAAAFILGILWIIKLSRESRQE